MAEVEYTVVIEPNDPQPGFTATVPALPGCLSTGESLAETLDNVRDAIRLWISMARQRQELVPEDFTLVEKVRVNA